MAQFHVHMGESKKSSAPKPAKATALSAVQEKSADPEVCVIYKDRLVETIKEVPVESIKEVIVEVEKIVTIPYEVIKEVMVEKIVEKRVEVPVEVSIDRIVRVEVVKRDTKFSVIVAALALVLGLAIGRML